MNADERQSARTNLYRIMTLFSLVFASVNFAYALALALRPSVDVGVIAWLVDVGRISHQWLIVAFLAAGVVQLFARRASVRLAGFVPHIVYASIGSWYIITNERITLVGVAASFVIMVLVLFLIWVEDYIRELLKVIDG